MANLEKIMAETSKSYDNSRKALNDQIGAISSDLAAQQQRINAQYAQQGKNLDNQRNWQAQASSMSASRNGGSFGGSAEIANKRYYQQAYVPAVTQMQTNQANDLSSAESQANQNRLSLQQTLAQLNDEANRYALQRYDAAKEAEREDAYRKQQMALQRQQIAAQNAANDWLNKAAQQQNGWGSYTMNTDANGNHIGANFYGNNNNAVTLGTFAKNNGLNALSLAKSALSNAEYNQLMRIYNAQKGTKRSTLNAGNFDSKYMKKITGGNTNDYNLMKRLGLSF